MALRKKPIVRFLYPNAANKHSEKAPSAHWDGLCETEAEVSRRISLLGFEMSPAMIHGR